jgi:hypothetical protein
MTFLWCADSASALIINGKMGISKGDALDIWVKNAVNASSSSKITLNVWQLYKSFGYTGNVQLLQLPKGTYTFELWGAHGGNDLARGSFAPGGYARGEIKFQETINLYVYVGCKGAAPRPSGPSICVFNGGGGGSESGGGGGATDIRLNSGPWNNLLGLRSRIIVAGGGGGSEECGPGGNGGGITGRGYNNGTNGGGTQNIAGTKGGFGYGGSYNGDAGGGGGGYYGGGCYPRRGGGGGSGFISGHLGCNAIDSSGRHTNDTKHYSGLIFTNTVLQQGVNSPNNRYGYVKIWVPIIKTLTVKEYIDLMENPPSNIKIKF